MDITALKSTIKNQRFKKIALQIVMNKRRLWLTRNIQPLLLLICSIFDHWACIAVEKYPGGLLSVLPNPPIHPLQSTASCGFVSLGVSLQLQWPSSVSPPANRSEHEEIASVARTVQKYIILYKHNCTSWANGKNILCPATSRHGWSYSICNLNGLGGLVSLTLPWHIFLFLTLHLQYYSYITVLFKLQRFTTSLKQHFSCH